MLMKSAGIVIGVFLFPSPFPPSGPTRDRTGSNPFLPSSERRATHSLPKSSMPQSHGSGLVVDQQIEAPQLRPRLSAPSRCFSHPWAILVLISSW